MRAVSETSFAPNWKPLPGSGRLERRARRLKAKAALEPETHQEKLERLEFWRVLRFDLYARDCGCCRACGLALDLEAGLASNALHAHHLKHRSAGGQDVLDNLAALCVKCHRLHHDGRLLISGTVALLSFVLRNLKGVVVRSWESELKS